MQSTHARKRLPLALGLALALVVPGSALAVESSSATSETLTIQAQITLTGIPASIAYGSGLGGDTLSAGMPSVQVSTNNPSGYTFDWSATDLTASGGTIASTQRRLLADNGFCEPTQSTLGCWIDVVYRSGGSNAYPGPAGFRDVIANNEVAATDTYSLTLSVVISAAQVPGNYTGTATFFATTNP